MTINNVMGHGPRREFLHHCIRIPAITIVLALLCVLLQLTSLAFQLIFVTSAFLSRCQISLYFYLTRGLFTGQTNLVCFQVLSMILIPYTPSLAYACLPSSMFAHPRLST